MNGLTLDPEPVFTGGQSNHPTQLPTCAGHSPGPHGAAPVPGAAAGSLSAFTDTTPSQAAPQRILGVDYWHRALADGTDLYLTGYGRVFEEALLPENWLTPAWFKQHRQRLRGTSAIYRVTTRPVHERSLTLIVRYSRVGEAIPLDTVSNDQFVNAQFNSPFEELAVLAQLRAARVRGGQRILTKRPLAILVPPTRLHPWQTGRSTETLAAKQARQGGQPLDAARQYLLVYGWIEGCDGDQAANRLGLIGQPRRNFLRTIVSAAVDDLAAAGFRMLDIKPEHVIVRFSPDGRLLHRHDGRLAYALVDYELLEALSAGKLPADA